MFRYGTSPTLSSGDTVAAVVTSTTTVGPSYSGTITATLTGLEPSTRYYVCPTVTVSGTGDYAAQSADFGAAEITSFTTAAADGTQTRPALSKPWLELPAATVDDNTVCLTHSATMNGSMQRNYSLLYDKTTYASSWVAYPLCAAHLSSGRTESWAYDPDIPRNDQTDMSSGLGVSVSTPNYASNTYSRGHQIPNADRNGVDAMMAQTYYYTNMTPQIQNGFNGTIWAYLEGAVRGAIPASDTLYVVTGAVFRKVGGNETIKTIVNSNDKKTLPVPNYYYKVLLKVKRSGGEVVSASTIGFWLDHEDKKGESYTSYAVSVDQIEQWTGFDFFVNVPAALQAVAETNSSWTEF